VSNGKKDKNSSEDKGKSEIASIERKDNENKILNVSAGKSKNENAKKGKNIKDS
jgi:hypothetical protein